MDFSTNWLLPCFLALFLYGIGQGLVKKNIGDVAPARFCLYFVVAKMIVNLGFFFTQDHPPVWVAEHWQFLTAGLLAYILDGTAWILYFLSIVAGPITIVGTLSAAYPALTVLFARIFLHEELAAPQYLGVLLVISGCIGLSYGPSGSDSDDPLASQKSRKWIPLSAGALVLWGAAQTIVKYSYHLPGANEVHLALFNTLGGVLTLGIFGLVFDAKNSRHSVKDWGRSFLPMAMMAAGDLSVIIASRLGPISIVTPLTGAYPVVTLGFALLVLKERITALQWFCVGAILGGMALCTGNS